MGSNFLWELGSNRHLKLNMRSTPLRTKIFRVQRIRTTGMMMITLGTIFLPYILAGIYIFFLQGWREFVGERRSCAGFLVTDPPIPENINLVLRTLYGVNWQRAVFCAPVDVILFKVSSALTGFSLAVLLERREFLRFFNVWAAAEIRAGLRDLAARGGILDLDQRSRLYFVGVGVTHTPVFCFGRCASVRYKKIGILQASFLRS